MLVIIFVKIVIAVYFLMAGLYVFYRRTDVVSPSVMFVVLQVLMFIGILSYVDLNQFVDRKFIYFYMVALISFCIGTLIRNRRPVITCTDINDKEWSPYQYFVIVFLVVLSIILSGYLFAQNGGNAFLISVRSLLGDSTANIIMLRSDYNQLRGIGYISQFRGIILPTLNILMIVNRKNKKLFTLGLIALPFTVIYLLGTGQRGQFAILVCVLFVDMYLQQKYLGYQVNSGKIAIVALIAFVLFSVLTVSNQRIKAGDDNIVVGVINAFVKRIMNDNQSCAVIGFRYIDSLDIVWGMDWWNSLKDLLPGKNPYISMESQIFKIIYGSTNGTSPPCIWGSAYYNWSYLGITVFPLILGYLYEGCYRKFLVIPKSQINIAMYAGKFILMGYWIASTPMYLINNGLVTLVILHIILTKITFVFGKEGNNKNLTI